MLRDEARDDALSSCLHGGVALSTELRKVAQRGDVALHEARKALRDFASVQTLQLA